MNNRTKSSSIKNNVRLNYFIGYLQDKIFCHKQISHEISNGEFPNYGNYTVTNNRSQNIAGYVVTLYVLVPVSYFSLLENTTQQ